MRYPLVLLEVVVALTVPLTLRADPAPDQASLRNTKVSERPVVVKAKVPPRAYYTITKVTFTGSHIPVVIRRYNGHSFAINSGITERDVLQASDPALLQAEDVGAALRFADPSITIRSR